MYDFNVYVVCVSMPLMAEKGEEGEGASLLVGVGVLSESGLYKDIGGDTGVRPILVQGRLAFDKYDSEILNSPLVDDDSEVSFGIGIAYEF